MRSGFASGCNCGPLVGLAMETVAGRRAWLSFRIPRGTEQVGDGRWHGVLDVNRFAGLVNSRLAIPGREGVHGNHNHVDLC